MSKVDERCYKLRLATESDAELVWQWRNHASIREWMFDQNEINLIEHKEWFLRQLKNPEKVILIFLCDDVEQGVVNFSRLNFGGVWDWGFYLSPERDKGIGHYMGKLAVKYAFEVMHVNKVCGKVLGHNYRSISFHEKLGFSREGLLRKHYFVNSKHYDIVLFGLQKENVQGVE